MGLIWVVTAIWCVAAVLLNDAMWPLFLMFVVGLIVGALGLAGVLRIDRGTRTLFWSAVGLPLFVVVLPWWPYIFGEWPRSFVDGLAQGVATAAGTALLLAAYYTVKVSKDSQVERGDS